MVVTVRTSPAPATHHRYHHHRVRAEGAFSQQQSHSYTVHTIITIITLTTTVSTLLVVTWW